MDQLISWWWLVSLTARKLFKEGDLKAAGKQLNKLIRPNLGNHDGGDSDDDDGDDDGSNDDDSVGDSNDESVGDSNDDSVGDDVDDDHDDGLDYDTPWIVIIIIL